MARRLRSLILLVPFAAYLFPAIYNRVDPQLFGLPFFYWYQLLWVALTSLSIAVVILLGRSRN